MAFMSLPAVMAKIDCWLILVFKFSADLGDRFAEVVG